MRRLAGRFAAHDEIDERLASGRVRRRYRALTATLQMFKVPAAPMYTAREQLSGSPFSGSRLRAVGSTSRARLDGIRRPCFYGAA